MIEAIRKDSGGKSSAYIKRSTVAINQRNPVYQLGKLGESPLKFPSHCGRWLNTCDRHPALCYRYGDTTSPRTDIEDFPSLGGVMVEELNTFLQVK